jgi:LAO/AO transport system kinase
VSSIPPPSGIGELADALDEHRASLDLAAARARSRRLSALAEFVAEHGERALRSLGGRRAAERRLAEADAAASVAELIRMLERTLSGD